jgi:hypothetical protein
MGCDILLRVKDKVNPNDQLLDIQCEKRGDFINVLPENWAWSAIELTHPEARIIRFTNVSVSEASQFLSEPAVDPVVTPYRPLKLWSFNLDSNNIPHDLQVFLQDDTRQIPIYVSTIDFATLSAWVYKKTLPVDPRVIG